MGQYYTPIFEREGKLSALKCDLLHDLLGAKLMEHSYFENELICAVANLIYKKPTKLVWLGDYGNDDIKNRFPDSPLDKIECNLDKTNSENVMKLYAEQDYPETITFNFVNKWFVNHDAKVAINFNDYLTLCQQHMPKEDYGWEISPISLLTAAGCGNGGGDYGSSCVNFDLVGEWTYCTVSIEDELPEGYAIDNTTYFSENDPNPVTEE